MYRPMAHTIDRDRTYDWRPLLIFYVWLMSTKKRGLWSTNLMNVRPLSDRPGQTGTNEWQKSIFMYESFVCYSGILSSHSHTIFPYWPTIFARPKTLACMCRMVVAKTAFFMSLCLDLFCFVMSRNVCYISNNFIGTRWEVAWYINGSLLCNQCHKLS